MLLEYINIVNGTIIKIPIKNITTPLTINWGDGTSTQTNITSNDPSYTYSSTPSSPTIITITVIVHITVTVMSDAA